MRESGLEKVGRCWPRLSLSVAQEVRRMACGVVADLRLVLMIGEKERTADGDEDAEEDVPDESGRRGLRKG